MLRIVYFMVATLFVSPVLALPNVVVSILPLHGIVSDVMDNIAIPTLLLKQNQSPHDYALRPSEARLLAKSDLIVWVGPSLEGFLHKPIVNIANHVPLLTIEKTDLPVVLKYTDPHDHGEEGHDEEPEHDEAFDPHVWLSAENAAYIAKIVAQKLSLVDPENARVYEQNAIQAGDRYRNVEQQLSKELDATDNHSYLVLHNAIGYFAHSFGLTVFSGGLIDEHRKPGLETIRELQHIVEENSVRCVFAESPASQSLVDAIGTEHPLALSLLDPVGHQVTPGLGSWQRIMNTMTKTIVSCTKN